MGHLRWVVIALALLLLTGCYGPNQLARGLDAWGNQLYVDSPWVAQLANVTGVFVVGQVVATAIDYTVLNPFDFWGIAVPTNHGTPYIYPTPMRPVVPVQRPPHMWP